MRRTLFIAALTLVLSASVFAQAGGTEQMILDLEKQARAAAVRGDASFLEGHATDDYMATNPRGAVRSRADAIADLKSGALKYTGLDADDLRVRVYGDTAIVTGHSSVKGTLNGEDISGDYRVTRVWVKQSGQWKLAAFQSTRVMPATP
jgi:ketosteroid isomerase-like protein